MLNTPEANRLRRASALTLVRYRYTEFRPDFPAYLADNWHVYREFERRAHDVAKHRKHYSARTIAEVIRHDTVVGELFGEYKINNNQVPDFARLFSMMNPESANLFEFREHKAAA